MKKIIGFQNKGGERFMFNVECCDKKLPVQYRRLVISKKYILIYYVLKNNVYIDTLLDARQNNSNKI